MGDDKAIQAYLAVTDDGEIARLAAMIAPKGEVFDARAQVAQATALQAEVASELVRRREAIANKMSYATLLELVRHFGLNESGILSLLAVVDEEQLSDDPLTGPVLRSLAKLVRAMPPPQDFQDQFLVEDPTAALELAASRTALSRPQPGAAFEETLRYAANIPADEVSWDILNGAFFDFLRMWFQKALVRAELFEMAAGPGITKAGSSKLSATIKRIQQELARLHDAFTPGQECPPDIDELARRAYAECWEGGLMGPLWRRRLAWLVVEFTPFWHRHEAAYLAIHQVRVKAEAEAAAVIQADQLKKSAKAQAAGEVGRQSREGDRWRSVTAEFLKFLMSSSCGTAPADLQDCVTTFVRSSPTLGGKQIKANTLEVLQTLCTAVSSNLDASSVLKCLQGSKYSKIQALEPKEREKQFAKLSRSEKQEYESTGTIPSDWIQYKALTGDAVSDCLEDLKVGLSGLRTKK
jgi:hypothetical protein